MTLFGPRNSPRTTPTMPTGHPVATFTSYRQAQQAVDYLASKQYPIEQIAIVGDDLVMVERVTGKLTYSRIAMAGAMSGMWFGLMVGLLISFVGQGEYRAGTLSMAAACGVAVGILFSVTTFALSKKTGGFTSTSQVVAKSYTMLCPADSFGHALGLLRGSGLLPAGSPTEAPASAATTAAAPTQPAAPSTASTVTPGLTYGEAIDRKRKAAQDQKDT